MKFSGVRKLFPNKERQTFDGGLNSKYPVSEIEANESSDCQNVIFTNGAVETRQGFNKVNTASVGSFAIDGLYTRRGNDNGETMCAFAGGLMYTLVGTSFTTVPSAQSVLTAGLRVCAEQDENYIFFGNGSTNPYKWNGTYFTRHGVPAPTSTMTVVSNGVGALTASGVYQYKYTFVNSGLVEGNLGPAVTFTISATSGQNTLTVPVAPVSYGVNTRRIYRTVTSGSTFMRLGTISDNVTTSFSDNVADSALGTNAPTDNGVPPNYSAIIYHQGRLFFNDPTQPNFVYFTPVGNPYTVQYASDFFKVGDNTSDLVKGFGIFNNGIVIFCEKSIWLNYMPDATSANWKQIRTNSPYGSKSPYCVLNVNNELLFASVQNGKFVGFSKLAGSNIDQSNTITSVISIGSDRITDRIEPDMFNVQEGYLGNVSGIVYKNKAWITLTYGSGSTANNRVYQMDFSIQDLSKDQKESWVPFTGISASQFTIYNGNLYFGTSSATGFVYQLENGTYNDDGAAINSYFWTKEFVGDPSDVTITKDFRYANILLDNSGAYYINLTYRADSDKGSGNTDQISVDPGGSVWGTMVWGRDMWGGGTNQKKIRQYLRGLRGERIQFQFSNQNKVNQKFKVHGLNFLYNNKGYR